MQSTWFASKPDMGHSTVSWNQKFHCKKMLQFFTYCKENKTKHPPASQNTEGRGLELTNAKIGLRNFSCVSKKVLSFIRSQAFLTLRKSGRAERTVHSCLHTTEDTLHALQACSAVSYHCPDKPWCNSVSRFLVWPWKRLEALMQSYLDGKKQLKSRRKATYSIASSHPQGVSVSSPISGKRSHKVEATCNLLNFFPKDSWRTCMGS